MFVFFTLCKSWEAVRLLYGHLNPLTSHSFQSDSARPLGERSSAGRGWPFFPALHRIRCCVYRYDKGVIFQVFCAVARAVPFVYTRLPHRVVDAKFMVACVGHPATKHCEPRQVRKEATAVVASCAGSGGRGSPPNLFQCASFLFCLRCLPSCESPCFALESSPYLSISRPLQHELSGTCA